jgi:hypothetical protein
VTTIQSEVLRRLKEIEASLSRIERSIDDCNWIANKIEWELVEYMRSSTTLMSKTN